MLANYHTHSTFCDGKNTPEEIVVAAIEKGFTSLGFSGHAYTPFDTRYCMKDTDSYVLEIARLKEKYRKDIQIYLGVEEDAFAPISRSGLDFVIGSSHYLNSSGRYIPIDSSREYFISCLEAVDYDINKLAEIYYSSFCDYVKKYKPDIIGHYDLITKYNEQIPELLNLSKEYRETAEKYLREMIKVGSIVEVNTGAITRGARSTVYPSEDLLYMLKKENAKITLSSDSHAVATLDGCFKETKKYLYDIGFRSYYVLLDGKFTQTDLI